VLIKTYTCEFLNSYHSFHANYGTSTGSNAQHEHYQQQPILRVERWQQHKTTNLIAAGNSQQLH
jgi:hypothetical protein